MSEILAQPDAGGLTHQEFPGANRLLSGFDRADGSVDDTVGERALFGLELDVRGRKRRWLLLAEVTERVIDANASGITDMSRVSRKTVVAPGGGEFVYESRLRPMRVTLFDPTGKQLRSSMVMAPWDFLCRGFSRTCDLARLLTETRKGPVTYGSRKLSRKEAARELYGGFAALMAFLGIAQDNKVLSSVLWQVIDRPSVFSVLLRGKLELAILARADTATADAEVLPGQPAGLRAYRVPLQIHANHTPVLFARMLVTDTKSPFRIGAGILALDGFRPSDPKVRFRLQLLAARRIALTAR